MFSLISFWNIVFIAISFSENLMSLAFEMYEISWNRSWFRRYCLDIHISPILSIPPLQFFQCLIIPSGTKSILTFKIFFPSLESLDEDAFSKYCGKFLCKKISHLVPRVWKYSTIKISRFLCIQNENQGRRWVLSFKYFKCSICKLPENT